MSANKAAFEALTLKKESLEAELEDIQRTLLLPVKGGGEPVGLHSSLVDKDGFPRADVDLFEVRAKRHRFACAQTDLLETMKEIERLMPLLFAERSATASNPPKAKKPESAETTCGAPIARVNTVERNSPAFSAGLLPNDYILRFGAADASNCHRLEQIGDVVKTNVGKPIKVTVLRKGSSVEITLVPQTWEGRGLLGCHLQDP